MEHRALRCSAPALWEEFLNIIRVAVVLFALLCGTAHGHTDYQLQRDIEQMKDDIEYIKQELTSPYGRAPYGIRDQIDDLEDEIEDLDCG